ncbi:hypothetical protein BCY84_18378 [Trypanosoma cruzi cruzi]|uniref:PPPDE domain-containing protein n=1 Tax=Trypanosoma cruzi TaxID=5693 RepID=A0A2V2ULM5_TRYCR|nr:putative PPPDE putative peptidase domain containing protein [Trypanosoma cruzi]PBJ70458.1 hypothetical protein BCY84_18378 [Trypanosoma cruzi cruzi]PWU85049.1 hypothetical protein C4B63_186g6 [Trypanosoma cruzi]
MTGNFEKSHEPFASSSTDADDGLTASPKFYSYRRIISLPATPPDAASASRVNGTASTQLPSFCPPQRECSSLLAADRVTFVLSQVTPSPRVVEFTVILHVYDLSRGLVNRHSEELLGFNVPGLYHSAVVCYGMEFIFGGGIAVMGAGHTRFGKKYKKILLGTTKKTLSEFMTWIREREKDTYHLNAYHPTKNNCHTFSKDAVAFLLGPNGSIPSFLTTVIEHLVKTRLGQGVLEVLTHYLIYPKCITNRLLKEHMLERRKSAMSIAQSAVACELMSQPPPCVVLFHVDDAAKCRQVFEGLMPYVEQLKQRGKVDQSAKMILTSTFIISTGAELIDPTIASDYIELVVRILMYTHTTLWGPVLNSLRIALLHKVVLCACVFHPTLLALLANGVRDFLNMTPEGRLSFLRVLCNLSSGLHGALALNSSRFALMWVSVVGLALADYRNDAIVYTGASLAVNLAHAFVLTTIPRVSRNHGVLSSFHRIRQLMTILLFYLRHWPPKRIPEAAMNMMLLALFFLMSSYPENVEFAATHGCRLNYACMLQRAQTNESKALLCLMHALEQCGHMSCVNVIS